MLGRKRGTNEAAFDLWQAFCESAAGQTAIFLWALAEATFWPIIPDSLLILLAVGGRRTLWRILGAAIAGSSLGGAAIYLFAYSVPGVVEPLLGGLPFIQPFMVERVNTLFDQYSVSAFWIQPWSGVAYKVYALVGAERGLNPWLVVPIAIVARALRMLLVAAVVGALARRFPNIVQRYWLPLVAVYLIAFGYIWWNLST